MRDATTSSLLPLTGGHRFVCAALAPLDRLRVVWLHWSGQLGRRMVRDREARTALSFTLIVVLALCSTLCLPLWVLALGPLVWGTPHLVSDIRYLVIRPGHHGRRSMWLLAGLPLLWIAFGGKDIWGFAGACAIVATRSAPLRTRALLFSGIAAAGLLLHQLGFMGELILGHTHNFMAVLLWWRWRRRTGRLHWIPLTLFGLVSLALSLPTVVELVTAINGLGWPTPPTATRAGPVNSGVWPQGYPTTWRSIWYCCSASPRRSTTRFGCTSCPTRIVRVRLR